MLKQPAMIAVLAFVLSGTTVPARATSERCTKPSCKGTLVYIGTQGSGPGQGIFAARLDPEKGRLTGLGLVAEVERPTWLSRDPQAPIVFSVSETGNDGKSQGGVLSFAVDVETGMLRLISKVSSGGGGATHLAFDRRLASLFVANYGTGDVSAIPVGHDGVLAAISSTQSNFGSGPSRRQQGPHAHGVTVDPTGGFVLSPDLGADRVFVYRFDRTNGSLSPGSPPFIQLPPVSGPRHLVFSPSGRLAFLVTELSAELYSFSWDAKTGRLEQVGRIALDAPDFTGTKSAAELSISRDGRFLYVSDRGANTLRVYASDEMNGTLRAIQTTDCAGQSPWSFAIDPSGRWLLVANQASSNLAVFEVDQETGKLAATGTSISVPKPVAITFFAQ